MALAKTRSAHDDRRPSGRFMWLMPDRLFYAGLLGEPTLRTMGCVSVYVAHEGRVRLQLGGQAWQQGELAVVPPFVPHRVLAEARLINVLQVEAETVDPAGLPPALQGCGPVDAPAFLQRVREARQRLGAQGAAPDPARPAFDELFFGAALAPRRLDPRIQAVVDAIKRDPAAALAAEDCAQSARLSFSRFLHLFKQEVGAPFRGFRTWKRARSLLHHVHRDTNLAHVAQDTGYPDSSHFSHSIRAAYGLKPRDIFAGSRRLAIYAQPG